VVGLGLSGRDDVMSGKWWFFILRLFCAKLELNPHSFYTRNMTDRRLRMVVIAEVCGATFTGVFVLVDLLEPTNRQGANIGGPIMLFVLFLMVVVGIVAWIRTRPSK
jgi:hypothetical protein